jgi:plasmid stabilization system protein ParE
MNAGQGFDLHPGAARDITEIWEFIAEDNPLAAGRVREPMLVVAVLHGRRSPRVIAAILWVRG